MSSMPLGESTVLVESAISDTCVVTLNGPVDYHRAMADNPTADELYIYGDMINYDQPSPNDSVKNITIYGEAPLDSKLLIRMFKDFKNLEYVAVEDGALCDLILNDFICEIPETLKCLTLARANIIVIDKYQEIVPSERRDMKITVCTWDAGTFALLSRKYPNVIHLALWPSNVGKDKCITSIGELANYFQLKTLTLGSLSLVPSVNANVSMFANLCSLSLSFVFCSDEALREVMKLKNLSELSLDNLTLADNPSKRVTVESLNREVVYNRLRHIPGVNTSQIRSRGVVLINLAVSSTADVIPSIVNDFKGIISKKDMLALTNTVEFDFSGGEPIKMVSISHLKSHPIYAASPVTPYDANSPPHRFACISSSHFTEEVFYPQPVECRIVIKTVVSDTTTKVAADSEGHLTCCSCVEKLQEDERRYIEEENEEKAKITQIEGLPITFIFQNRKKEVSIITSDEESFKLNVEHGEHEKRGECSSCHKEEHELEYVSSWPYPTPRKFSCACLI